MVEEMRAEIAQLIKEGHVLNESMQALRAQLREKQSRISELSGQLNILAKLGSLSDDDKKALHQILAAEPIATKELMHAPQRAA